MTEPLNLTLLMLVVIMTGALGCLWVSPPALDRVARKMRARARGLRESKIAYDRGYHDQMLEDSVDLKEMERCRKALERVVNG